MHDMVNDHHTKFVKKNVKKSPNFQKFKKFSGN